MKHLQMHKEFLLENTGPLDALPKFLTRELTRGVKGILEEFPPHDMARISEIANEINDIIADKGLGFSWSELMKSSAKMQGSWLHPIQYFTEILNRVQVEQVIATAKRKAAARQVNPVPPEWDMRR